MRSKVCPTYLNGLRLNFLPKHSRKILTYLNLECFFLKMDDCWLVLIEKLLAYKNKSLHLWIHSLQTDCQSHRRCFVRLFESFQIEMFNWWLRGYSAKGVGMFFVLRVSIKCFVKHLPLAIRNDHSELVRRRQANDLLNNFNLSFVS